MPTTLIWKANCIETQKTMKYIWHSIRVFHEKSDLHVRTLNFKAKSWLLCLWLWGLHMCSKLYCDWSVHHWNFPNFTMNGKYPYAPEIKSLSSCIKVIPQYCTAMNDVNVCLVQAQLPYIFFIGQHWCSNYPPKIRKIRKNFCHQECIFDHKSPLTSKSI